MANDSLDFIHFDESAFDPGRIQAVTHTLVDHPLLQLPALIELADRMPERFIRYHSGNVQPSTRFETAPETDKVDLPPDQVIRNIEEAGAWLSLHHIQQDPEYGQLVRAVLDSIRPKIRSKDTGLHNFAGWIFVSSPGAVTPYHMDHENNFILQLRGEKEIHVFDPLARSVVTELCLEDFHRTWSRELVTYDEAHEDHAVVFDAKPGDGAFMPATAPHWVKNGDNVSITISFTFYSRQVRRRERLHQFNYLLRKLGLDPTPVGKSGTADLLKTAVAAPLLNIESRLRGRSSPRGVFAIPRGGS